ncbi:MAG: filamentous hemagglutinin N-terminal protein, partial [Mucilaginibacter sp.]|nr:filamentous hemagglutinin N-terminal protein [Mucilaginibacter sp.]
ALAENRQLIQADGGTVVMTAAARDALLDTVVNNTGVIEARTLQNQDGSIKLLGGMEGGTVRVEGTLDASAPNGGNGGSIETSGAHVKVGDGARITTAAPAGKTGTWLIDPQDFTIGAGGDIDGATLGSNLDTSDVAIQSSTGAAAGSGDINVNQAVTWTGAHTLSLQADNNININAAISGANGGLTLNATGGISATAAVGVGTFTLQAGNWSQVSAVLPAFAASDFQLQGGSFVRATSGDGSAGTPYTLADIYGVQGMATLLSGHFVLGNDIDASGTAAWNLGLGFTPVGNSGGQFTGSLDGNNHTISGLTVGYNPAVNSVSNSYFGLFGYIGTGGVLQNLGLLGGSMAGFQYGGALAGYNSGTVSNVYATTPVAAFQDGGGLLGYNTGTVSNSHADAAVSGTGLGSQEIGGLVGRNSGSVSGSYATGAATGDTYVGGLVGYNTGTLADVHATGATGNSSSGYVGGLVGYNTGAVTNAYATGAVTGLDDAGGLAGANDSGGTLSNVHATGQVSGSVNNIGGLAGYNNGSISNAYATGAVSGGGDLGGLVGKNDTGGSVGNAYASGAAAGSSDVGGLVGENDGAVSGVHATGNTSGSDFVGGLVGINYQGTTSNAYATGQVSGSAEVGGLVGYNYLGSINVAYAGGAVTGATYTGGLIGYNYQGTIANAYASGAVSGNSFTGGLAGVNSGGNISDTYASGAVRGVTNTGGFAGNNSGMISLSYWDMPGTGQAVGIASGPSRGGATGLITGTALMQSSYAGFDFGGIWWIAEGQTRPQLCALSAGCHSSRFNGAAYAGALNYADGAYGASPGAVVIAGYAGAGDGGTGPGTETGTSQPNRDLHGGTGANTLQLQNFGARLPAGLPIDN